MTLAIAIAIVRLVLSGLKGPDANRAGILVQIAGKVHQAYQNQTGAPLDPSLIKPE